MNRAAGDQDAEFKRILDRLQITPEYVRDTEHDIVREALSTTDKIAPNLVRPIGITWPFTGFWQISRRNGTSFAGRAAYDTRYARRLSFGTDLKVLFATVWVVLYGTGC